MMKADAFLQFPPILSWK